MFAQGDLHAVLEHQKAQVKEAVQKLQPDYLLNVNEQELAASLVSEMELIVPTLREEEIHIASHEETDVDVSHDPMRFGYGRGPFYIKGNKTVIAVPFDGDAGFFKIQPSTYNMNPPRGQIVGQEIHLTYVKSDQDAQALKTQYERDVNNIKQYLQWHREGVSSNYTAQLPTLVKSAIETRKKTLVGNSQMIASLGLPMKKREGVPTT